MKVQKEGTAPELKEFIDQLIVPLLVDRWNAEQIGEVENTVQTWPGVILTHGPAK